MPTNCLRKSFLIGGAIALIGFCADVQSGIAQDDDQTQGNEQISAPLQFDTPFFVDPVEVLQQSNGEIPTKAEEDAAFKRAAAAFYATGRIMYQREEFSSALQRYQRAWRYDPTAISILREIVPLAFTLKRSDEAARYAIITAESDPRDSRLLRRLAFYLTEKREHERALKLYELATDLEGDDVEKDVSFVLTRLEMGKLYFLTERYHQAAAQFEIIRDAMDDPDKYLLNKSSQNVVFGDRDRMYALLGECFLEAGRLDVAREMFQKSHDSKANPGELLYRFARLENKANKNDDALKTLEKYFAKEYTSAGQGPYVLLAKILNSKFDDPKEAQKTLLARLEKLVMADEKNITVGYYRAEQLLEAEQYDEAEKAFLVLLKEQPVLEGYQGLIRIEKARNNWDGLLTIVGEAISLAGSFDSLGGIGVELIEDAESRRELLKRAEKRSKSGKLEKGVAFAASLLAIYAEDIDQADRFLKLALDAKEPPAPQVLATYGLELISTNHFDRSAEVFAQAIDDEVQPENDSAFHYYRASALSMAGDDEAAIKAARKAVILDADSPRFEARLAWVHYRADKFNKARELYVDLLRKYDDKHDSEEVREIVNGARSALSEIELALNDKTASEEWLEQVLDESPEDVGALNNLGYLWADHNKNLHRSLEMISIAVKAEPENLAYRDSLGWVYYRLGKYPEAVHELKIAVDDEEPGGVVLDHYGDALWKNGQTEQAMKQWRAAYKSFQEEDDTKRMNATHAKIEQHTQKHKEEN